MTQPSATIEQPPAGALIELSYVIPLYFDQHDHQSVTDLLRMYEAYDRALMDRIQFVLVDDGSPLRVALPKDINLNILLLRIRENITWNQGGARNLGVVYSRSDKILASDLDHQFSQETLRAILALPRLRRTVYRFHRLSVEGKPAPSPPNIFIFSRGRFLELHGVDEEFCGHYGCEDGMFWRWQRYNGTRFRYFPERYPTVHRKLDLARSYHSLVRDTSRNTLLKKRKQKEWATWGPSGGHSRKFLSFTWDTVEDRRRQGITWVPSQNRWWKKTWHFRWLFG
jgi:hypothetical protein